MITVHNLYGHFLDSIDIICPHENTYYCETCLNKFKTVPIEYDEEKREML